jgi:hypothetical protein
MRKASALVVRFVAIAAGVVMAGVADREAHAQTQPTQPTHPTHRRPSPGSTSPSSSSGSTSGSSSYVSQPLNLQREQLGSAGLPVAARARMRSGDCAGALDIFDAALETLTDPTLHRDRGLCHDKLGHVYPAMEDYRIYLTESPDAIDAAGITERLQRLQEQASGQEPAVVNEADDDVPPGLRIGVEEDAAAAGGPTKTGKDDDKKKKTTKAPARTDKVDYVNAEEDVLHTSLRAGTGISLAPLFAVHKWLFQGDTFGDSQTWSETLGVQVRDAFGPGGALVVEAGYEHFNSTSIDPSVRSGLTALVAYELRFELDPEYDNQLLLTPGLGYEHLEFTYTDGTTPSQTFGAFVPRVRAGWRHMIQPSTAFDLSLDLGVANFFQYSSFPFDSKAPATGLVALEASMAWGL